MNDQSRIQYLDEIIAQNEEETCKKNQIVDNNQKQIKEKKLFL